LASQTNQSPAACRYTKVNKSSTSEVGGDEVNVTLKQQPHSNRTIMNQLQFFRVLVIFNGTVPLLMLSWDAWRGLLGANSVNNALHITGILSLMFLFLSLLITPLRWITGWGGWAAFRRSLGLYGFFYAVVHLIIYVGFDRALSLTSTLHELWTRRFLQVGVVAILLMVPLAVTSTNRMIQRLGPKRWKLLHRSAYAVAILGVLHYYMLVKSDVRQPLAFAGVLTGLMGSRIGRHYFELQQAANKSGRASASNTSIAATMPVAKSQKPRQQWKGELKIGAIFQETPDVKTFRLVAENGGLLPFEYEPGQFLSLQLSIDGKRVNRSYTIASTPTRAGFCELSIKREPLGLASQHIHDQLKVGDSLNVSAPAGKFSFTGREAPSVLLIAGGVGITPLMSIVRCLTDKAWSGNIYFLIVARTERDLIFRDEIEWLRRRFTRLHVCMTLTRVEPGSQWTGECGRANAALLRRFVPNVTEVPVYLCGPNEMMDATRELLQSMEVPDTQVHTEAFGGKKSAAASNDTSMELLPAAPATESSMTNGTTTISFARSFIETEVHTDTTILEAAEAVSIALPWECRSGVCGHCKTRLISGSVQMDCEDALSPIEKSTGFILACQARPLASVVVDA